MYENKRIKPVETVLGKREKMKENDEGGKFN
jgi:hypothetical protein